MNAIDEYFNGLAWTLLVDKDVKAVLIEDYYGDERDDDDKTYEVLSTPWGSDKEIIFYMEILSGLIAEFDSAEYTIRVASKIDNGLAGAVVAHGQVSFHWDEYDSSFNKVNGYINTTDSVYHTAQMLELIKLNETVSSIEGLTADSKLQLAIDLYELDDEERYKAMFIGKLSGWSDYLTNTQE